MTLLHQTKNQIHTKKSRKVGIMLSYFFERVLLFSYLVANRSQFPTLHLANPYKQRLYLSMLFIVGIVTTSDCIF